MNTVRKLALDVINEVLNNGAYSNLLLSETIKDNSLNNKDKRLLTELVYGTIQYKMTLDYYINQFIGEKKIKNRVRNILRMAFYQKIYLDKIPDFAIINEAVELTKISDMESSSLVNAVLRNLMRRGTPSLEKIENHVERLAIETSHPLWLVQMWSRQFDFIFAKKVCFLNNIRPNQFARLNLYKDTKDNIIKKMEDLNLKYENTIIDEAIFLEDDNIANTYLYKSGYVNVQDLSSMLVSKVLAPKKGERILDVCSAPGGKATHIAELMENIGEVIACDIHEHKVKLIEYHKNRLGLSCIKALLIDARLLTTKLEKESFDRVLVDAPCSGFGVIRRKPEIKYNKKPEDLDEIIQIQKEIIDEAVKLVKKGGTLVYSTCTINKKENEKMVEYILNTYQDFILDEEPFLNLQLGNKGYIQIIDQIKGADIFFIACFKRKL